MKSNLKDFEFKYVDIVDIYGKEYKHYYVDVYTSAPNNDENEESLGIFPNEKSKNGVELFAHEIKSIRLSENE